MFFVFCLIKMCYLTVENVELYKSLGACNDSNEEIRLEAKWSAVHSTIVDVCVALAPLSLPPYVLLEIIDWFPCYERCVRHKKKIDLILNVLKSVEKFKKK